MRRVDRTQVLPPAALHARRKQDNTTELERATDHYGDPAKTASFDFSVYSEASVKRALHDLFHGKCAYCESFFGHVHPVDVEHYRPKNAVSGVAGHRGYWWLAMDWDNLLPSCIDCNRRREQDMPAQGKLVDLLASGDFDRSVAVQSGKGTEFPLSAGTRATGPQSDISLETRLLLDPTRDDPADHLAFHVDRSRLVALVVPTTALGPADVLPDMSLAGQDLATAAAAAGISPMGVVSIKIYGLNRLRLVQVRTKLLRDMEFLTYLAIGLLELCYDIEDRLTAAGLHATDSSFDLERRMLLRLKTYLDGIRLRLKEMTSPKAPYSALAETWVKAYVGSP